ncbi:uncharacterized protein LOC130892817 [Diorhabda carinulata]|uniref:uncharacterized protein LOC130892817 n=1 Tax=Diorhabda carinulata TaxID=1163345 RepID=UPI0025A2472E|nr:uncharacterized protein LOC130892817 [Diorhabda carinulata]
MADEAIYRRKSQLFLNNIAPVKNTYDELVKKKLKGGKFPGTKTGIIKIIGMLVLLFAVVFFLVEPFCDNTPSWYPYLLPLSCSVTILTQFVLFIFFSMGRTVTRPGFWIYLDIGTVLLLSITSVICSVLTSIACQGSNDEKIGPSCGMAGSVVLIISCGSIFLMFRYVEDEQISYTNDKSESTFTENTSRRKSMHV